MNWIKDLSEGNSIDCVYLCKQKQSLFTKNRKPYIQVTLQDKTGQVDGKIWEPPDSRIDQFEPLDFVHIQGDVSSFMGTLQLNIKAITRAAKGDYQEKDYLPVSAKDNDAMFQELSSIIQSIQNSFYRQLLTKMFLENVEFAGAFRYSSAAKSIHHGFVGGLLEHTLSVTKLCIAFCDLYPILKRDLLLTAAICHDIGKIKELSPFPDNTYTDDGQLIGHIVLGAKMVWDSAAAIEGFPPVLLSELVHCILAHQGKLEYGSPKVPALIEATALSYADDTDAKIETFTEALANAKESSGWLPYQRLFETPLRFTE
jgi:3'-5' exoribonuclease